MAIVFVESESRRRALFCLLVLAVLTAIFVLPFQMRSNAAKGLIKITESHEADLPNYDIRSDKTAVDKIVGFRSALSRSASQTADERESFVRGENALRQRVPTLKVEYNDDIRIPEVIGPDVKQGRAFLSRPTTPAGSKHADVLVDFLKQNSELVGSDARQIDDLKVFADYTNPDGNLSFVELDQEINGIPVFRGEVKAGFTRRGEMIRVINNLAPGLDYDSLSTDFGDPLAAVRFAAGFIHNDGSKLNLNKNKASTDLKAIFGTGDSATTAEKMYFPTEPGVAVPAWRVLIWQPVNAYYVIVNAQTGAMLWRKNITDDQTQSATYSVYANPNAMINVADNPFPLTPGPTSPNGTQGAAVPRTSITRIGNEAPYTFNNLGWMTDGFNKTDGNAIQAGLDRDEADDVDPNSEAVGASRTFNFTYNPLNPNTNTGDAPIPATQTYPGSAFQQGTVTQMFYIANWYHDELYRLGFTEAARNFQNDNFGRGGVGNDRISGEGQDSAGTNNANFSTPADGGRGRMQMYIWTGPNPDIDGNIDADVVIHEITHGTSNRLHGNGSGLSTNMSGGMGEGWGDFYGHCLLSEPTDPIMGIYTTGGYATYLGQSGTYTNNYYYGIRRFPKAVMAFTGGPNNRPHNPMTFADTDSTQFNINDGAFARGPYGLSTVDQTHNLGEIWSSTLWEVRAKFVTRLGWAVGNRKALQLVTDGMKLAPLGPTFLSERDAILSAARASSRAPEASLDVADVWAGFAVRGIGASASIQNPGSGNNDTRVTEAFDLPNLTQSPNLTISDTAGDGDGFPEPGEAVALTIPLTNLTGNDATGVTLQVVGGGSGNYGNIADGATVSQPVSYTVPAGAICGSIITLTLNVNSNLGATSITRTLIVGNPNTTFSENFDAVTAPAFPAGWTAASVAGGVNFVTSTITSDTAPNAAFALDPAANGGGTDLTSPSMPITSAAATVTFRHSYDTEPGWDGGVLEISIGAAAFQDVITAGGAFVQNGYDATLGAGTNNPLANRSAWAGSSGGFITSVVRLPAAANGQNVRLKWRFGADDNTVGSGPSPGWRVDSIRVSGSYTCSVTGPSPTPTASPSTSPTATSTATATPTGTPGCGGTFSYTGPAVPITDNTAAGVNFTIPVSGLGSIADLNFRFDGIQSDDPVSTTPGINHSFVGDIVVKITSPAGTTVSAFDRPGVPATTFGCPSNNLAQIILDDDGGFPAVEEQCATDTTAFPTGSFSPNNALSVFDGQNPNGNWTINISDNAGADTGSARAFSLVIGAGCTSPTATPTNTPTATATSTPAAVISGTVTYGNAVAGPTPPRPVSNVTITGAGSPNVSTTTSFPAGTYSLSGFGAGSYVVTPTKTGGVNGITGFDAAKIAQHVAGISFLTGNQLVVADVSGNGTITSFDAAQIANYVVTVPPAGSTGTWRFTPVSRTYSPPTTRTGEDYSALLMGEVSGNWTNSGARSIRGSDGNEQVTAPRLVTPADDDVIVPVSVAGTAGKGIIAYEFDLRYDPAVIQPQANPVDLAGTVSGKLAVAANTEEAGLLKVAVYGAVPIAGDGVLLNLRFSAIGAPGAVSPLEWDRVMLNEDEIGFFDGQVELSAAAPNQAEISGRLLNSMGQGVPHARVTLTDTTGQSRTTVSNGFGVYRFGGLQVGQTYTIRVDSNRYNVRPLTVSVTGQLVSVDMIAE